MDDADRVSATQNIIEIVEGAGCIGDTYLNCKPFETEKWRNLIAKVMEPS